MEKMPTTKSKRLKSTKFATSTPNAQEQTFNYTNRGISPIRNQNEYKNNQEDDNSSEKDNSSRETSSVQNTNSSPNNTVKDNYAIFGCTCVLLVAIVGATLFKENLIQSSEIETNCTTLSEIQSKFPSQSEDFWVAISSGIDEVKTFNKPSVFLLLYDKKAGKTLDLFLQFIGQYASCILNLDHNVEPIALSSNNLNTEAKSDYGYILSKYKPELEKRSIMIVKNLDKVSGQTAQAFHSLCDEFVPLVDKSVYIFTIQINNVKSGDSDYQIVEHILKENWHDLDDEIFIPLLTRISSMILRIEPEGKDVTKNL